MKNICMLVQSSYPADPRVRRQAEKLQQHGYNVDIICLKKDKESKKEKFGSINVYRIFSAYSQENFVRYIFVSITFLFLSFFKLFALSLGKKYDLIQVHNMPDFLVFVAVFQKVRHIPIVLDVHDLTLELFLDKWNNKKYLFIIPVIKFVEKISYKFADRIITVNDMCKEILIKKGVPQKKIFIVLNTANTSIFKFDQSRCFNIISENAKLLYHGTVAQRFGLHIAISSMVIVNEKIPGSVLNIYGKYDKNYKEELIDLIQNLNLQENVFLNEAISLEKIYEIIIVSDIGIVPYLSNNYMNLSLSTKTFEYAASGLPIVSTKLSSLYQIFGDKSLAFIENLNPESLAKEIVNICLMPEKRNEYVINAYNSLKEISGTIMGDRYLKLIEDTIEN